MESTIKQATDQDFAQQIASGITLVDFFAEWCGPCRMLSPVIEEIAEELKEKATFLKVNVDDCQQTAGSFQVTSIPTLVLFKDGKEVGRIVGLKDAAEIKEFMQPHLS